MGLWVRKVKNKLFFSTVHVIIFIWGGSRVRVLFLVLVLEWDIEVCREIICKV